MKTREFTKDEVFDADSTRTDAEKWRHGTRDTLVLHLEDGTHWEVIVEYQTDDGPTDYQWPVEGMQVVEVPVQATRWIPV